MEMKLFPVAWYLQTAYLFIIKTETNWTNEDKVLYREQQIGIFQFILGKEIQVRRKNLRTCLKRELDSQKNPTLVK